MEGEKLTTDELITTCILLAERGPRGDGPHHRQRGEDAAGNRHARSPPLPPMRIEATVEEILRFDPALHMFTR